MKKDKRSRDFFWCSDVKPYQALLVDCGFYLLVRRNAPAFDSGRPVESERPASFAHDVVLVRCGRLSALSCERTRATIHFALQGQQAGPR